MLSRMLFGVAVILGIAAGVGTYTFGYAKGYSYLSNDPAACANCHIMNSQYDAWIKSSHGRVATCNDCHTPHELVPKYLTKASNGFWHSFGFTTGWFPEPIRIKPHNLEIAEQACRTCHSTIALAVDGHAGATPVSCTRCHRNIGHD